MINKFVIDLRQFNNGESEKITFPTFDQCMMYGIHKLKKALRANVAIIKAVLIEDSYGRRLVITPTDEELGVEEESSTIIKKIVLTDKDLLNLRIYHDDDDDTDCIYF